MTRSLCGSYCVLLVALTTCVGCGRGGSKDGPKHEDPPFNTRADEQPLEPLPEHPQVELSNLRFGRTSTGHEEFSVDWRYVKKAPAEMQMTLFIRTSGGSVLTRPVESTGKKSGTISGEMHSNRPRGQEGPTLQSGCEMYVMIDAGVNHRYKLSNSVTSGNGTVTPTRQSAP